MKRVWGLRTSNIERSTSNTEVDEGRVEPSEPRDVFTSKFDVQRSTFNVRFAFVLLSGVISLGVGLAVRAITHDTLNLFIGSTLLAAILIPPLSAMTRGGIDAMCLSLIISLGLGGSWLLAIHSQAISVHQWCICMLILGSFVSMIACATIAVSRIGLPSPLPAGVVTLCAMAWLTWPIWLSGALAGQTVHWLVQLHPVFAFNATVAQLGNWTEQPVAYNLTNLGQDVQYHLPPTAGWAIGFQIALAMMFVVVSYRKVKPTVSPTGPFSPA